MKTNVKCSHTLFTHLSSSSLWTDTEISSISVSTGSSIQARTLVYTLIDI